MRKLFALLILLVIIAIALGYFYLQSPESDEKACLKSGGKVTTGLCCQLTDDFPNLCLIGARGRSPQNSKETKICDRGADKCFDGKKCSAFTLPE